MTPALPAHFRQSLIALATAVGLAAGSLASATIPQSGAAKSIKPETAKRVIPAARPLALPGTALLRADAAPVTVSRTAPGQAGYVHFFIITDEHGETETQVGLELPGDRIAWSVPGLGVNVRPFIASGELRAGDRTFRIEHLYGLKPHSDEAAMRRLAREVERRAGALLGQGIPYCEEGDASGGVCMSCLGFVLRVLYPGSLPQALPQLPPDFLSAQKNLFTTEDLLLYLAGVRLNASHDQRVKRIHALQIPEKLREELLRIAGTASPDVALLDSNVSATPSLSQPRAVSRGTSLRRSLRQRS